MCGLQIETLKNELESDYSRIESVFFHRFSHGFYWLESDYSRIESNAIFIEIPANIPLESDYSRIERLCLCQL